MQRYRCKEHVQCFNKEAAIARYFGTYRIGEQRRFRRACAYAQSRLSRRFSHTQSMVVEEESDQKTRLLALLYTSAWSFNGAHT